MSMYTHLLGAACGQRRPRSVGRARGQAVEEVRRCRHELRSGRTCDLDPDTVTVPDVLALEISYDVALIELATEVGVDTDLNRFDQPERERARLEHELAARGIDLDRLEQENDDAGSAS